MKWFGYTIGCIVLLLFGTLVVKSGAALEIQEQQAVNTDTSEATVHEHELEPQGRVAVIDAWRHAKSFTKSPVQGGSGVEVRALHMMLADQGYIDQDQELSWTYDSTTEQGVVAYFNDIYNTRPVSDTLLKDVNHYVSNLFCPQSGDNPRRDPMLLPIDRSTSVSQTYRPDDLVLIDSIPSQGAVCVRTIVQEPLLDMLAAAELAGHNLVTISSFRRSEVQDALLIRGHERMGAHATDWIAHPGHSEHQLGTAIDFSSPEVGNGISQGFGDTAAYRWLLDYADIYGFVLSYPAGKRSVTGYNFEPWHWRYVGKVHATRIKNSELTPNEYLRKLQGTRSQNSPL